MNNNSHFLFTYLMIIFLMTSSCMPNRSEDAESYDLIIYNIQIVDGTGTDPFPGYVGIRDNVITRLATSEPDLSSAATTLDGQNKFLSPGFIDLHSHGDVSETPAFQNFLAMGVTTITLGQDGGSPTVQQIKEISEEFQAGGLGTNVIMFYGHGTLREESNTGRIEVPDSLQFLTMDSIIHNLHDLTFGLSMGLEYSPGLYAQQEELTHLARAVGKEDGLIMSHIRNEDDDLLHNSINEMLALGAYCRIHISHLKSVYGKGTARGEEILGWLHQARDQGIPVSADVYPYTASYTGISILFPEWSKTSDQFAASKTTRREELEQFLNNKIMSRNGPQATLIGTGEYAGMTLAEAAASENVSFTELLIEKIGPQGASGAYFVMNDSLQSRLIIDSLVGICSDGSPTGYHPRGHGTFARMIEEYVVKREMLTLEEAVHKMTGFAAAVLGLKDRGLIKEGMKADLILFEPNQIHETARFEDPFRMAEGFDFVMVNGKWAKKNGQFTDSLSGTYIFPAK